MNGRLRLWVLATVWGGALAINTMPAGASVSSFSLRGYPGITQWNALGIAADPGTGNVFVDSLSYGGEDNLYHFTRSGELLASTRTNYFASGDYSPSAMVAVDSNNLYVNVWTSTASGPTSWIAHLDGGGSLISITEVGSYRQGLGYMPASNHLFTFDYSSPDRPMLEEMTLGGAIIGETGIDDLYVSNTDGFVSATYDPSTQSLYAAYFRDLMVEYRLGGDGAYHPTRSFDLGHIGVSAMLALDRDRATGDFYVQDNNDRVLRFSLDDLVATPAVPEPGHGALLVAGLAWLAWRVRAARPGSTSSRHCDTAIDAGSAVLT